jgi:hypothetical protein
MNKQLIAIMALLALGLAATGVFAFGFGGHMGNKGNNTALTNAIAAGDYNAYLTATNSSKHQLNETQFDTLATRYKQNAPVRDAMQRAQTALQNKDYNSWKQAMSDLFQLQTTQDKFDALVQHQQDAKTKGQNWHGMMRMHRGFANER